MASPAMHHSKLIPEIELIIGKQPAALELGGAEAQNRFNFVFQNFIKVFTKPEHPLTIFLDDLQWARHSPSFASLSMLNVSFISVPQFFIFSF